jgi:hypothetical protein
VVVGAVWWRWMVKKGTLADVEKKRRETDDEVREETK